jgi:hypothetical protein
MTFLLGSRLIHQSPIAIPNQQSFDQEASEKEERCVLHFEEDKEGPRCLGLLLEEEEEEEEQLWTKKQ